MEQIKLGRVGSVLENLTYPLSRAAAADQLSEVTLVHAGGEANLGALVSEAPSDSYQSAGELEADLHSVLPVDAVGESGESEGEG